MKLPGLLIAAVTLAANPLHIGDTASRARYHEQDVRILENLSQRPVAPSATPVVPGSSAPDFSYQSLEGQWLHLHDLLEQGPVMLVFGGREADLVAIEREREHLLDIGIMPVAVVHGSARAARSTMEKGKLTYTLIPDGRGVIAGQFNAVDPVTLGTQPCWFVLDRNGRVRSLDRTGLPEAGYAQIAARGLALPSRGVTLPSSH